MGRMKRLFAAAENGDADARDAVVRIARTPGHWHCGRAQQKIATWWADTRDPELRQAVLDTGAVSPLFPARLQTLALLDGLAEWDASDAVWAPDLLADPDPDVRERTAAACRSATGPLLEALWTVDHEDPSDLLHPLLLANGEPPPAGALDALCAEWLADADEALGEALFRWARPATAAHEALREALSPEGHPLCTTAAETIASHGDRALVDALCERALAEPWLAELCTERGLAPSDPPRRGVFFLLTRQVEQYRAVDPDGSLLGLAYRAAPSAERARIRKAMLTAGELDLVRVVSGEDRRANLARMSEAEIRYLAKRLTERREWDELWAFVQDVPILLGVDLIRLFGGWRPRADDELRLFRRLHNARTKDLKTGLSELQSNLPAPEWRARLHTRGRVAAMSFAPDGPFLAVASGKTASVFDVPAEEVVERYDGFDKPVRHVLHLGGGVLVAGENAGPLRAEGRLTWCAEGAKRRRHATFGGVVSLGPTGEGAFAARTLGGKIVLGDRDTATEVDPRSEYGIVDRSRWWTATDRESGRIAVGKQPLQVIDPAAGSTETVDTDIFGFWGTFLNSDALLCTSFSERRYTLTRVSLPDGRQGAGFPLPLGSHPDPVVLPHTGRIAVLHASGDVHLLDGDRLRELGHGSPPQRLKSTQCLAVSPDEDRIAVGHDNGVDLFDLRAGKMPALVRRPMAEFVPRDLELVADAVSTARTAKARSLLQLVQACLHHRFRYDVEVGEAVRLSGGEYDISL